MSNSGSGHGLQIQPAAATRGAGGGFGCEQCCDDDGRHNNGRRLLMQFHLHVLMFAC